MKSKIFIKLLYKESKNIDNISNMEFLKGLFCFLL